MKVNLTPKPINFKLGEYINKGVELLKKDFGNIFLAFLACFVMSIIPFCGLLAMGNMYKYLQRLNRSQPASPGDIFDFKDFMPYFMLQLIIFGGVLLLYIPLLAVLGISGALSDSHEPNPMVALFVFPYIFLLIAAIYYFVLKGFYIIPLISLKGIKEVKEAWNISKIMTKGNLLSIFLFSLVVSILSQIGIVACGIGIFLTLPFLYTANYFAYEDAIQQIEYDEIIEIGSKNEL
ncbi:hypothetical protein J2795_003832 [Chryseobacterium bernardetii]|jgi:hypothetical protein|uniref:Uncharacterized protein n=2 Tax=Chryseobacterium TaxID=59732 RepID=A0A543E4W8_9FLAO|nr:MULTISPECIES: hypothetical protein [Chryseobacterium]MDR6372883.1 hypothetical protein [Chryseobacterium vietnamense]MDR6443101.1 hypothetical protein [Chryseobacterium bernardetii]MDR6489563.1 hypothetical protein [Chryseobacterium vietnamense]TQM16593.1 hypothetical protein FB551_4476 [Chryseobacterium aquifrigidense]